METVSFTRMADGTAEDYELLARREEEYTAALPDRLLGAVRALETSFAGYQVSRLEHSLQSATRALRDGRSDEYVVAALLHDIGDELAPYTHGQMVAAILRPYVEPRICWMVERHGIFQQQYYGRQTGRTPTLATAIAHTSGSTTPPSSASSTTRTASTPPTTRFRSRRSSPWSGRCSRSRATSSGRPDVSGREDHDGCA